MRLPSQWFLAMEPIDLRCGMDRLLVWVQRSGGAASGSVGAAGSACRQAACCAMCARTQASNCPAAMGLPTR